MWPLAKCSALLCELKVVALLCLRPLPGLRSGLRLGCLGTDARASAIARAVKRDSHERLPCYLEPACSVADALQTVVNDGLRASLNASDVVAHRVNASLGWVDLDDRLERRLAPRQLVFPKLTLRLAFLEQQRLRVRALVEHLLHVSWLGNVRLVPLFFDPPPWGDETGYSSAHTSLK